MSETVHAVGFLNLVAFVALGLISFRGWLARRDPATGWAAASFGVLGAVVLLARVVPQHPHGFLEGALLRFEIVLLVVFPYFLFRFTNAFGPPSRRLFAGVSVRPSRSRSGRSRSRASRRRASRGSAAFTAYLVVFVVHWTILSIASAVAADSRRAKAAERRALADADARGRGGNDHARDHPGGGEQRRRLAGRARPGGARLRQRGSRSGSGSRRRRCSAWPGAAPSRNGCSARSAS